MPPFLTACQGARACYNAGMEGKNKAWERSLPGLCAILCAWVLALFSAPIPGAAAPAAAAAVEARGEDPTYLRLGIKLREAEGPFCCGDIRGTAPEADEAEAALSLALEVLCEFPEGFFPAVSERAGGLRLVICSELSYRGEPCPGLTLYGGGAAVLLDAGKTTRRLILHELAHAAEAALELPDEQWERLCPEGFEYPHAFCDEYGRSLAVYGSPEYTAEAGADCWFINRYAKTSPAEDRAVLFETLMLADAHAEYLHSPHIIMKYSVYFAALRASLGGASWEAPFWEEKLYRVLNG